MPHTDSGEYRILCFGDSLTWGDDPSLAGRRLKDRWPVALKEALGPGYAVIEEGQCGRNIATDDPAEGEKNGIRYIRPCLESHCPLDLLIIMLGTNDCKRKYNYCTLDIAWEMEQLLQKVLTHRQYSALSPYDILLVAPPPMNEGLMTSWLGDLFGYEAGIKKSAELSKWYGEIAGRYGIGFFDAAVHCHTSPLDGVHMDPENQRRLGEAIAAHIKAVR